MQGLGLKGLGLSGLGFSRRFYVSFGEGMAINAGSNQVT